MSLLPQAPSVAARHPNQNLGAGLWYNKGLHPLLGSGHGPATTPQHETLSPPSPWQPGHRSTWSGRLPPGEVEQSSHPRPGQSRKYSSSTMQAWTRMVYKGRFTINPWPFARESWLLCCITIYAYFLFHWNIPWLISCFVFSINTSWHSGIYCIMTHWFILYKSSTGHSLYWSICFHYFLFVTFS